MVEFCGYCRFWDGDKKNPSHHTLGDSRVNPPVVIEAYGDGSYLSGWPRTARDSWCAMFQESPAPRAPRPR